MCAKVSKPLTSFHPASFLLVWDPIFGFKCMMYDVLFALPIPAVSRPRSRSDPIGESKPVSGCETIYWDSLFFFFFFELISVVYK